MEGVRLDGEGRQGGGKIIHQWRKAMNDDIALTRLELDGVIESLSEGLEITDMHQKVIRLNAGGAALLGFASEADYRKAIPNLLDTFEVSYPDGRPMPIEELPFSRAARGETLTNYVVLLNRRDTGKRLMISYNGSVVRDDRGTPVLVVLTFRELAEQYEAFEDLAQNPSRSRIMSESVPYGVWWCNPHGGAEYMSQSFLDLLEMKADEVKEFGWTRRMRPDAVEPMMKKWIRCVETGEDWEHEHDILGPNGNYHAVLSRGKAVRDPTGAVVGWAGVNLEFDKRKALEEALRESEERFRTMADRSPIMIWVTSTGGEIEMVNRAYEEFFGISEPQVRATAAWHALIHPDDAGDYLMRFTTSLREQKPFDAEARVRNRRGEWRWVRSSGAPRFSSTGEFLGIVCTSPDITDQKRASEILQQNSDNLKLMVTHSADAMVIVNGSGVIEAVSESGARLLGFEEAELLGKSVEDLTEPYSRIERAVRLQDLQQNSMNPTVSVLRVKTKTGAFQWMSVVVTMIRHRGPGVKALVKLEKLDLAFRNMAAI